MSKEQRPFYKGVDFKKFTNKDGYAKGGVEYNVSEIKMPSEIESGISAKKSSNFIKMIFIPDFYPSKFL